MCTYIPDRSVVHAFSSSHFLTKLVLPYGICAMPVLIQILYIFSYLTIQSTFEARIETSFFQFYFALLLLLAKALGLKQVFSSSISLCFCFGEGFRCLQRWKRIFVGVLKEDLSSLNFQKRI